MASHEREESGRDAVDGRVVRERVHEALTWMTGGIGGGPANSICLKLNQSSHLEKMAMRQGKTKNAPLNLNKYYRRKMAMGLAEPEYSETITS